LDSFERECGPFSRDQEQMLGEVVARITRKIAGALARELKEFPEKVDQEQMTTVVRRLFRLEMPEQALAGSTSQNHSVGAVS